jgi:hypothetical protein
MSWMFISIPIWVIVIGILSDALGFIPSCMAGFSSSCFSFPACAWKRGGMKQLGTILVQSRQPLSVAEPHILGKQG